MINERRYEQFKKYKRTVLRMFPHAETKVRPNGKFTVEDGFGRCILRHYPDVALCDNVFNAWKNITIIKHWDRIEQRNIKKSRIDVKNVVGNTSNMPKKAGGEYQDNNVSNTGEVYDEANQYSND